jgi:hypothetical protein
VTLQGKESIVQILECAIVASWNDLVRGAQAGLIHIEYELAPDGTVDSLKVWSSTSRGHWFLACEYWMSSSTLHGVGILFHNGYTSEGLAHTLEFVMHHQTAFSLPTALGRQGLLQIQTPTQEESVAAPASVSEALNRVDSTLEKPVAA